jgi:hypothetical protein
VTGLLPLLLEYPLLPCGDIGGGQLTTSEVGRPLPKAQQRLLLLLLLLRLLPRLLTTTTDHC